MALAKSNTNDLASLFKEGFFKIPAYQRKYSWTNKQIDDLFNDLYEGFRTKTSHFLGTLSLHKTKDRGLQTFYDIIDGQQRFTSVILFYNALANMIEDKIYLNSLKTNDKYFLEPIDNGEKKFYYNLLDGKRVQPKTNSQKLLVNANKKLQSKIKASDLDKTEIEDFLIYILNKVHFLIYLVDDLSEAIRMFEIINDRGLPLKYFDKIKSFFMYYSNKYLENRLNPVIEEALKNIYNFFDDDKLIIGINNDEALLLQHYLSNSELFVEQGWGYTKATSLIYQDIKRFLTTQVQKDIKKGENFIKNYLKDINKFIEATYSIEKKVKNQDKFEEFYLYLNPEKRMYPLSIRLEMVGLLDKTIKSLEIIEFHLKHRKNPKKAVFSLLMAICEHYGSKRELLDIVQSHIIDMWAGEAYVSDLLKRTEKAGWASKYILFKYSKIKLKQHITYDDYKNMEIEHVFSQEPSFNSREFGFTSKDVYSNWNNRIGNLTLLEKELNKEASNKVPREKMDYYYINSKVIMTKKLRLTSKKEIVARTRLIEKFADNYFSIQDDISEQLKITGV